MRCGWFLLLDVRGVSDNSSCICEGCIKRTANRESESEAGDDGGYGPHFHSILCIRFLTCYIGSFFYYKIGILGY